MGIIFWTKINRLADSLHDTIYTEVQYDPDSKQITNFVVIQLVVYQEVTHEVKKHDCAHGKYHVHHYYEGPHAKVIETNEPITAELFWQAKKDTSRIGKIIAKGTSENILIR